MEKIRQEAILFFRSEPGFEKLFIHMRKRYQSLGRIGGTVSLTQYTDEEKQALGAFFGKDFTYATKPSISLKGFATALENTRFSSIPFEELLSLFFRGRNKDEPRSRRGSGENKAGFLSLTYRKVSNT
ncbi:TIGR02679 domain-containing protein [Bacillus tianshenii]|nr:TIGR02679 domain-containing protein [Bacillus tianshenii]